MSRATLPLSMINPGEQAKLIEVCGGHALHKRLSDLSLSVGTGVQVAQGDAGGPLILAFKNDPHLALGRGVAQTIMVKVELQERPSCLPLV